MTKHDAMKAYFEPKVMELVQDRLGFNFSPESPDSVAFITNYSDKVRKKYIRIGAEKEYGFSPRDLWTGWMSRTGRRIIRNFRTTARSKRWRSCRICPILRA